MLSISATCLTKLNVLKANQILLIVRDKRQKSGLDFFKSSSTNIVNTGHLDKTTHLYVSIYINYNKYVYFSQHFLPSIFRLLRDFTSISISYLSIKIQTTITVHAKKRMKKRNISIQDIYKKNGKTPTVIKDVNVVITTFKDDVSRKKAQQKKLV
jgi:hypothetical protein